MIRPARTEDRMQMAQLVYVILCDMELPLVSRYDKEELLSFLVEAMADPTYRYSETRALVKECEHQVVGVAFGYPASDEPIIDQAWDNVARNHKIKEPFALFVDKETLPNEWYLDSICIASSQRGKGLGSELLQAVETVAKQANQPCIGLCCDQQNQKAKKLYEKMGYQVVGTQYLGSHLYEHMQKRLMKD